jgi:anti-sigma regulatory factor (Ser/Thr protein kinase)
VSAATIQARFEPKTASVARARLLVRSSHAEVATGMLERIELVVSELASNAVMHAKTPFDVRLIIGDPMRVEVTDGSPLPPLVRKPVQLAVGGRGLLIVAAVADRWAYELIEYGKVVWAEFEDD